MRKLSSTLFLLVWALPVWPVTFDDPLRSEAQLPLAPSAAYRGRDSGPPCVDLQARLTRLLTPADAIDLALCNHPQTREVWAASRAQAAQLGIARAAWLPGLNGTLGQTRYAYDENGYTKRAASLNFSWLIYDFGQRAASENNAEALLAAVAATQDATVQSLFLAALQAYYTAQANQSAVVAAQMAERSAAEALAAAEARHAVGVATPADRLQAQTAYSQASLNRIRAEGDARNAQGALAFALGFPAGQRFQLAEPQPLPATGAFQRDVEALITAAQAQRPDLKAADAQLKAAQASIDLARAQGRPNLTLNGGPLWQESAGTTLRGNTLGLTLNVPIFTGFDNTYRVRAAEAQSDVKQAQRDRLRNQVALDVWKAYQSLTTASQSLKTSADLVASAEQSERVALGRYKAGVGSVLDVLSAQSALASARVQRIQAEMDGNVYRASLAQAMGSLDYSLLQGAAEGKP